MKAYGVTIQMKPFLKVVTSKGAIYLVWRHLESRLRQTANVNLYHVSKFSLYLSFSVHCFHNKAT